MGVFCYLSKLGYNNFMNDQITHWLGTGAINIFGAPLAGKDTLGLKLTNLFNAQFISSGDLVRAAAAHNNSPKIQEAAKTNAQGILTPTKEFQELIIPYLKSTDFDGKPLILSSVGRWYGEEIPVMAALEESHHPLKAVIILDLPETIIRERWAYAQAHPRNGGRADDQNIATLERRLDEFSTKTQPVLDKFDRLGLSIHINSNRPEPEVLEDTIAQLAAFAANH